MSLAKLATGQKKPTKSQAFSIIKLLAADHGLENDPDMAKLYAYFLPPLPKKAKTPFEWVARAMADKDIRYYLNYVYITDKVIVATDGHRLHIVNNDDQLEPGFYNKAGDKVESPGFAPYPDYERVIPDIKDIEPITMSTKDLDVKEHEGLIVYVIPCENECVYVQKPFLDACSNGDILTIYAKGKNDAIRVFGYGEAVIMPVRQRD